MTNEVDLDGRYKDTQRTTDCPHTLLRERTGVETLQDHTKKKIRQRHENVHGGTISADGRHLQELTRQHSTMALNTVHINQARDVRLVDDWMNPWPIPGEKTLNTIKETYDKIKKRFST